MRGRKFLVAAICAVALGGPQADGEPWTPPPRLTASQAQAGVHADPEKIRAAVKLLASDGLEGRGTGQRGGDLAADYLAKQFASLGLEPAGDNGTYFQAIPMIEVKTLADTAFTVVTPSLETMKVRNLEEFVTSNESRTASAYVDAPIVFVGYGIRAPEYGWDDYKDTILDGKVALVLADQPASVGGKTFKGETLTDYGGWRYKFDETAQRGAIATLIIHRPGSPGDSWEVVRNSWGRARIYLEEDGASRLRAASWLASDAAKRLVAMAGFDLDQLFKQAQSKDFRPIELPLRLQAHVASRIRPFVSRNVLAVRPARGAFAEEAVLYTAHYDHLGTDPGRQGHNIYNGAVDATGCGVLLEVARAWAKTPAVPSRAIVFAALAGEDQGLLGSEFLARHSPVPPGKISLDLNYDALPPIGEPEAVVVGGAERTTFYSTVKATTKALQLAIERDRPDDPGHRASSDLNLARAGIPSFSLAAGQKFKGHPATWGAAQNRDYLEHRYRQPTDQYEPGMAFAGAARLATLGYELGVQAASQTDLVAWLPGDVFEAERKRSQRAEIQHRMPERKARRHPS
ncbi:MAG TPA: M28 family peptidase [Steroidobacteraceae bacterium]|nr:M28 family peptidase [Steroidobacteraceae bacterium]